MDGRHGTGAGGDGRPGPAAPPGWWPSPFAAATVAAGKISRSGLQVDGDDIVWTEGRPAEGGRQVVVRSVAGAPGQDVSPPGVNVRTRVHEYGGGAALVSAGTLFYVDDRDQQWYRIPVGPDPGAGRAAGTTPVALTEAGSAVATRHADGRVSASGRWLLSVAEDHLGNGGVAHRLVGVAVDGSGRAVTLTTDTDFVAAPRPSPDGRWLCWIGWDHPSMPWDRSVLWLAAVEESDAGVTLRDPRAVAGGESSVGQPRWASDGILWYVDDRTGWWRPHRLDPRAPGRGGAPLSEGAAEFHAPDWVLGQSTMAELADGTWVCRARSGGRDHLVRLRPPARSGPDVWSAEEIEQPCVSLSGVAARPDEGRVYLLGSTPEEASAVFELRVDGGRPVRRISTGSAVPVRPVDVSVGRPITAATPTGPVPGLFYPPTTAGVTGGAPGERPPLVVFCHGGPTAAAEPGFDPVVQFFTSRGLAVAAVDYRGSSGHGRAFRQALVGRWGEADVDDCAQYAASLADNGLVDGARMAIRGTSAGGFTALCALARGDGFAGAVAWYGVTDLEALAADTHDFESRYVDSLVGPWPAAAETYRARSPIHAPQRISGRVLLLQGADDPVVPADQSERFAAALGGHGVSCHLVVFEGESHGFRRAETIEAALLAELEFYRDLFGDRPPPVASPAP